jgi:hypothetical protein
VILVVLEGWEALEEGDWVSEEKMVLVEQWELEKGQGWAVGVTTSEGNLDWYWVETIELEEGEDS